MTIDNDIDTKNNKLEKIAFGGGCYWCTEAVFQSLKGVKQVEQGFIRSTGEDDSPSEAVIVHYTPSEIDLDTLIAVHLHTHSCTSDHSLRTRYRSAIYTFNNEQIKPAKVAIKNNQKDFNDTILTKVLPFGSFEASEEKYHNYYLNSPDKPFCQTFIHPKLQILKEKFTKHAK